MSNLSLLLVDDEKPLLALLKKYFERQGHTVDTAETGTQAIEKCRQLPCPFQLIVLDLKLPDMSGLDVLQVVQEELPEVRVLISSGTPWSNECLPEPRRALVNSLLKPYMPRELNEAIQSLLGTTPGEGPKAFGATA